MSERTLSKKVVVPVVAAALIAGAGTAALSYAQASHADTTSTTTQEKQFDGDRDHRGPGVLGTVSAINGTGITLTNKDNIVYTIDASNAKVLKHADNETTPTPPTTITVSDIKVGDTIMVRGTITGTSVTANEIMDGKMPVHQKPAAVGTISAIDGSTITLIGKSDPHATTTTYSIDASNAKILKAPEASSSSQKPAAPTSITVSDLKVGDTIMVRGTVNGTTITATDIMDGKMRVFGDHDRDGRFPQHQAPQQ